MGKFSQVAKGTRALKRIEFTTLQGEPAVCAVRQLLGSEQAEILSKAREYAIAKGLVDPKEGDSLYELGKAAHTLLLSCIDPDDPGEKAPFFDGGAEQILGHLDPERIFLLKEQQAIWQDARSSRSAVMTTDEYIAEVYRHAALEDGADLPFESWPPVLRRSFVVFTTRQLWSALLSKSPTSSDSSESSDAPTKNQLDS